MRRAPEVLVILPTYEAQRPLLSDVLWNIINQTYRNYNLYIVVNNSSQEYFDYVSKGMKIVMGVLEKEIGYTITNAGKIPQIGDYKGSIGAQAFNLGLEYATDQNYDYALLVAGDIAIPDICIKELLRPFRKFKKDCGLACLTCYIRYSGDGGIQGIMDKISEVLPGVETRLDQKIPMIKPLNFPMTPEKYYRKRYLKALAGDGAMMIPRKVFSKIRMRTSLKDGKYGADIAYCLDMKEQLNLFTYIVTDIYTPHMNIESDGKIVAY